MQAMRCSRLVSFAALCVATSGLVAQKPTVCFVGGAATATAGADGKILTYLQTRYTAANVTYKWATGLTNADILGYDAVVLSATADSSRYRGKVDLTRASVVNLEEAVAANDRPGQFAVTNRFKHLNLLDAKIVISTTHPITAGLPLKTPLPLYTGQNHMWWSIAPYPGGTKILAAQAGNAAYGFMSFIEAGGALLNSQKAPCRRVMFGMDNNTFANLSPVGLRLFGQAVDWAAKSCCAQSSNYGVGLKGTVSIPEIKLDVEPRFLKSVFVEVASSTGGNTTGAVLIGLRRANIPIFGGRLLTTADMAIGIAITKTGGKLPMVIPDLSALCGWPQHLRIYLQAIQIDVGVPQGLSFSPGLRVQLGH